MATSRRFFLGAASALAATRVWGANDKANIAIVGVGGRGTNHLDNYSRMPESRVAAIVDIDQAARETANARLVRNGQEKAREFEDMRAAFADPGVDAVSIAAPNHWHALATILALKAGKDVYCEKPACHNIHEGLEMVKVARETKKMVQIGSQHRSTGFKIRAFQALQQGVIGKIYMAKGLCYKRRFTIGKVADSPVPAGVNWDFFRGPAPMRPYNANRFKYKWHWFWDTGNGDIGNQGVHEIGLCRWALGDPEWPKTAFAQGGKFAYDDDQETPNTLLASFNYGEREIVFEVRGLLTNPEGGAPGRQITAGPRPTGAPGGSPAPSTNAAQPAKPISVMVGNLFYGSEGWAVMSDDGFIAYKGESSEPVLEEKSERDATVLHMQNFLAACKSRNPKDLHDPIDNAHLSAGLCHLANISYRVGRRLTLDAGPKFAGDAEANKMLTREYRKPYVV